MGDRANVFIQQDTDPIRRSGLGIYAHWAGLNLHTVALEGLSKAQPRIGDPSYATRIIVNHVLVRYDRNADTTTGFGLWTNYPDDNEHPYLIINAMTGDHWYVGDVALIRSPQPQPKEV